MAFGRWSRTDERATFCLREFDYSIEEDESALGHIVRRKRLKHSIGNLSLVTRSFNSKLSNKGFEIKKAEFIEQSVLMLNKDITLETEWNEEIIEKRSKRIFELAKEIWPVPTASVTGN